MATFTFKPKSLIGLPPKSRTVKDENGKDVVLWSVPLQYRYDDGRVGVLEFDYPEMRSGRGIRVVDKKSYRKLEIVATLPMEDEDSREFYEENVKQFNERVLEILCEPPIYQAMYGKGKDPNKARILLEEKYYSTFFTPTNMETGEKDESANPITKLNIADFDGFKTCFNDLTGKPLSDPSTGQRLSFGDVVRQLTGTGFSFVPRVSFSKVDIGATSIRAVNMLRSALITSFREGAPEPDMSDVSAKYLAKYGNSAAEQIHTKLKELAHKSTVPEPTVGTLTPTQALAASAAAQAAASSAEDPDTSSDAADGSDEPSSSHDLSVPQQPWTIPSMPEVTTAPMRGFKGRTGRK